MCSVKCIHQFLDGKTCIVFDACIHTRPFSQAVEDFDFKCFISELAVAYAPPRPRDMNSHIHNRWIQNKYECTLSMSLTFPKMIVKGKLVPHMIQRRLRPVIAEVEKKAIVPTYTTVFEPPEDPQYLVVQIHLPLLVRVSLLYTTSHFFRIHVKRVNWMLKLIALFSSVGKSIHWIFHWLFL